MLMGRAYRVRSGELDTKPSESKGKAIAERTGKASNLAGPPSRAHRLGSNLAGLKVWPDADGQGHQAALIEMAGAFRLAGLIWQGHQTERIQGQAICRAHWLGSILAGLKVWPDADGQGLPGTVWQGHQAERPQARALIWRTRHQAERTGATRHRPTARPRNRARLDDLDKAEHPPMPRHQASQREESRPWANGLA